MNKPTLVSVCGDPGGANAVAAVLKVLETDGRLDLAPYAYNEGVEVLNRQGIRSRPLPAAIDAAWTLRRLEEDRPALVFTGTSHNGRDCEKLFISTARGLGIRSLAVLDFWSNYAVRFSDDRGALTALPDSIAAMDQRAKSEMIAAGIPGDIILVTGQPAFDALPGIREAFSAARKSEIRRSLGLAEGDRFVLFASQPLKRFYPDVQAPSHPGYDEHLVLSEVIRALESIAAEESLKIFLLVRPHPRENVVDFNGYASREIRLKVSAEGNGRELAMSSDLVVGMNSVFLMEACYLDNVVLSLQPGLRVTDALPTNGWGASRGITSRDGIGPALRELLLDETARRKAVSRCALLELEGKAARRIADHIHAMAGGASSEPRAQKGSNS
jgi:hypothetical protein